jgi:hypothetical protein
MRRCLYDNPEARGWEVLSAEFQGLSSALEMNDELHRLTLLKTISRFLKNVVKNLISPIQVSF